MLWTCFNSFRNAHWVEVAWWNSSLACYWLSASVCTWTLTFVPPCMCALMLANAVVTDCLTARQTVRLCRCSAFPCLWTTDKLKSTISAPRKRSQRAGCSAFPAAYLRTYTAVWGHSKPVHCPVTVSLELVSPLMFALSNLIFSLSHRHGLLVYFIYLFSFSVARSVPQTRRVCWTLKWFTRSPHLLFSGMLPPRFWLRSLTKCNSRRMPTRTSRLGYQPCLHRPSLRWFMCIKGMEGVKHHWGFVAFKGLYSMMSLDWWWSADASGSAPRGGGRGADYESGLCPWRLWNRLASAEDAQCISIDVHCVSPSAGFQLALIAQSALLFWAQLGRGGG